MTEQLPWDHDAPLSRALGESSRANDALNDYWLMGSARSLRKLLGGYGQQVVDAGSTRQPPTTKWTTLSKWSHLFGWQDRVSRQKEIDDALALAAYRARHMSSAEVLARLADQARADMADFAGVRTQNDLVDLPQSALVKKITAVYRKSEATGDITGRVVIDLHDAQEALKMIGKHYGLFTDRLEIEGAMDVKGYQIVSPDDWDDDDTDNDDSPANQAG